MTERVPDNVVYIDEWLERDKKPDITAIRKRLAEIGTEQLLLASEKNRLTEQLRKATTQEQALFLIQFLFIIKM